jgi:hypothetical protein
MRPESRDACLKKLSMGFLARNSPNHGVRTKHGGKWEDLSKPSMLAGCIIAACGGATRSIRSSSPKTYEFYFGSRVVGHRPARSRAGRRSSHDVTIPPERRQADLLPDDQADHQLFSTAWNFAGF